MTDADRTEAVRVLGDPILTRQQAQVVLALYAEPARPLDALDIEAALDPSNRDDPINLVKVLVHRIRSRTCGDYILNRRLKGYELSASARAQVTERLETQA